MNTHIIDRRLPERSRLSFIYKDGNEQDIIVTLPFFENVQIREQKKARYETFKILARSSDLYAYLGADSRMFTLDFSMTLPHIQTQIKDIDRTSWMSYPSIDKYFPSTNDQSWASILFEKPDTAGQLKIDYLTDGKIKDTVNQLLNSDWGRKGITPKEKEHLLERYGDGAVLADLEDSFSDKAAPGKTKLDDFEDIQEKSKAGILSVSPKASQLIDTIMFWVNIVRSSMSTAGGSYNSGPPIIRLDHGIMYQSVPCICTSVNIESDEVAGYDIDTLLPRKIDISMTLEEHRLGDFGGYAPSVLTKRDNLAGWEAVLEDGTMDPGGVQL